MSALAELSGDLARAVERAARAVVAVNGRLQLPSTGVQWRAGVIVTADHTLATDEEITVEAPDGRTATARLVGRDAATDLAVLRTEAAPQRGGTGASSAGGLGDLSVADIADSTALRVGHVVLAVGWGPRASWGVVSALGASGAGRDDRDGVVRLDLTMYPGFSGGPLVDAEGRVLGINTSGRSRSLQGAVPAAVVSRVVEEIVARGRVSRGFLGVGLQPVRLPEGIQRAVPGAGEVGLILIGVQPDGPAARAGLFLGDVLVALDGGALREPGDVQAAVAARPVGAEIRATILRAGAPLDVTITLGERPARGR